MSSTASTQRVGLALLLFGLVFKSASGDLFLVAWALALVGLAIVVFAWLSERAKRAQSARLERAGESK